MTGLQRARNVLTSRLVIRGAFLAYFVWACVKLMRFASWARGEGPFVARPESPAGILPIGHFTSFFAWLKGGGWDTWLPAGLVIILGALTLSVLLKRGFCGWICPVGAVWQGAAALGRRILGRNLRAPRWLDLSLLGLRFLLAAAAFGFIALVPLPEALAFRQLPYMWVADIKIVGGMLDPVFLLIVAVTFVVSIMLGPVWCRWLCPLGALYSAFGVLSVATVSRDENACIHCRSCTTSCPAFVDVEKTRVVRAIECDGCMDCVKACPVEGCLEARVGGLRIASWAWPVLVVGLWLGIFALAKATGNWDTSVPLEAFRQIIRSGLLEQQTPTSF